MNKAHRHLSELTLHDINSSIIALSEAHNKFFNITSMIHNDSNRHKRSLLSLGGLFSFLFSTADQEDLDEIKRYVKTIYDNQMEQAEVLSDIVSIANVSRALINENRIMINAMIQIIDNLKENLQNIQEDLQTLFTTRRFLLIHGEILIHAHRLRVAIDALKADINNFEQYLMMLSSGKLNPALINPTQLKNELISIQKQLPPTIRLPQDPLENVWHYYKYLTVNYMPHVEKIIMLIKIPLVDNHSLLGLYKVYNLPVLNPGLGKSVKYNLEGHSLAVSHDLKYATIPTDSEFIECTLASGHFCSLRSAMYHMHKTSWCLTALFLKNDQLVEENCEISVTNVTGSEVVYLDQGNWPIATTEPDQMEIICTALQHAIPINPPITSVNLQPACSAFSSKFKLPPYFRKLSKGFAHAIKEANLHTNDFIHINFRIWNSLNVSNFSDIQISSLKKLDSATSVPVNILKAKINLLKSVDLVSKPKMWIFIGGGSGSGLLLMIILCLCVCWQCRKHQGKKARSASLNLSDTSSENLNMMHARKGAIKSYDESDFGQETVRIQGSERHIKKVRISEQAYSPESLRLLNQLERYGVDVSGHHRTLGSRPVTLPSIEYHP